MLNTLLDINQIDGGTIRPEIVSFPINDLLRRLRDEFSYHAQARGLSLRVVSCGLSVESDPHLLEQIIRNLVSNALKYTKRGKVLLGCRRHSAGLTVEVWDTGIGVSVDELQSIFHEYYQVNNAARERSRLSSGWLIYSAIPSASIPHRATDRFSDLMWLFPQADLPPPQLGMTGMEQKKCRPVARSVVRFWSSRTTQK
jgi:K+-sensing histidine kinase KdpD